MTPRLGWHTCAECPDCDGGPDRDCTWSAYCEGAGHQNAACAHPAPRTTP